jgi:HAD superfamily hydrolase (TIGR01509 family)
MPALLLGSISTLADTSELQRQAFNQAFADHGLDWHWDQDHYRAMLSESGGQARIEGYAQSLGQTVDAKAVHATKSRVFQQHLANDQLSARPGVLDAIRAAHGNGWKTGLVTTTSPENVASLLRALSPRLQAGDFDVIVDATSVQNPKPDPAAYLFALHKLDERAVDCVAVEDNKGGVQAATAAGITCVAFPNENTADGDFTAAQRRVARLDPAELLAIA